MKAWFWILGWSLSILTTTGNGFIIFLVCNKQQLRTKTNAFIVSLAVADFCVGMSAVPSRFACEALDMCNDPFISRTVWISRNLFAFASVTNLSSLVLDRYIAVTKPLQYLTFMKRRRVILMVSLSWAIPIALIASFGIELFVAQSFVDILICILIIFELLPSMMLIFCFVPMLKVVFKHNRAARSLAKQLRFNHRVFVQTQEKSAIIMMGIVIGLFLVCYGLYFRCSFLLVFKGRRECYDIEYKILVLMLNSAVNPLAYSFLKRDIKKEIKGLLCCSSVTESSSVHPLHQSSFPLAAVRN